MCLDASVLKKSYFVIRLFEAVLTQTLNPRATSTCMRDCEVRVIVRLNCGCVRANMLKKFNII